jgi:hypothetical protein
LDQGNHENGCAQTEKEPGHGGAIAFDGGICEGTERITGLRACRGRETHAAQNGHAINRLLLADLNYGHRDGSLPFFATKAIQENDLISLRVWPTVSPGAGHLDDSAAAD